MQFIKKPQQDRIIFHRTIVPAIIYFGMIVFLSKHVPQLKRQISLRWLFGIVTIAAICAAVYVNLPQAQIHGPPPLTVLKKLDERFDNLPDRATETQFLEELGLGNYRDFLMIDSYSHCDKGGSIYAAYFLGMQPDYSLTVHFFQEDSRATIYLHTPVSRAPREKEIVLLPEE